MTEGLVDRVIAFSVRRRGAVIACSAALAIAGALCLFHLPMDALPDLSDDQVLVFAEWPGRSPREVEDHLTHPLSARLQGLAGVRAIRATSELGFSLVTVVGEDGSDPAAARSRVLERLSTAGLPRGVVAMLAPDATAVGQILWYTLEAPGLDLGELRALQDSVVRVQLAAIPGVADVASAGGFVRQWQVDVDPLRLRAYELSLGQVRAAVARAAGVASGGVVAGDASESIVRGASWVGSPADLESAVVATRAGTPVLVRNVATVRLGPAQRRSVLEKDGAEAVGGVVLMRRGENALEITERVEARIAELQGALPPGARIVPFYRRTPLIRGAIATLRRTLTEEMAVCALMVLLVLGHARSSLVVLCALPLSVLLSFLAMRLLGISSNVMSLTGIAVAIGVLADSAIVMTENAFTRLHERFGERPVEGDTRDIVVAACRTVGRPLFFSVLITIVSFLPVFALSGMEGKLFRPLAWTKTFALASAALLAISLVPALIPTFVRGRLRAERESWLVRGVADVYRPVLAFFLQRPGWVVLSLAALLGLGAHLARRMGSEFMPALDEGAVLDMPVSATGISVPRAARDLAVRDALLRELPEVAQVVGKAGRAETPTDPAPIEMLETIVSLRARDEWPRRALPESAFRDAAAAAVPVEAVRDVAQDARERFDSAMRRLTAAPNEDLESQADAALVEAVRGAATARSVRWSEPARLSRPPLRRKTPSDLLRELDAVALMPGWANSWTAPIAGRIEMLSTGVRSPIGVKVFGQDPERIQKAANQIAAALRAVPGVTGVVAEQAARAAYLEIEPDRSRAAALGVSVADIDEAVETALAGAEAGSSLDGRRRVEVRVRYALDDRGDAEAVASILVGEGAPVPLRAVAQVRRSEAPSMIRSENGVLLTTVQMGVQGRDLLGAVEEARSTVDALPLPGGVLLEWSGQFEHAARARRTLLWAVPLALLLILAILYLTYRDAADMVLMALAVPGAVVGGLMVQAAAGYHFSVAVWVGYIACFGLATETGIIMLVYLREAIERRGGLSAIGSEEELRAAVLAGAVQRLRPKLLTEGVIVLSLLPMLWASGVGAEVVRPMAAPVLGGILVADEVIDLAIPVLFYWQRLARWARMRRCAIDGPDPAVSLAPR